MAKNTSWTGELSASAMPVTMQSTSDTRPINFAAASDVLVARARKSLPPLYVSVLARYTGFQGLDSSEYAILVTALISLTNSSPTADQLIEARGQLVSQGFTGDFGGNKTIWSMDPIRQWYEYAALKTTSHAPDRLILREDWGEAEATKAIKADARALAEKLKRYMNEDPNILKFFFNHEGLSWVKLDGDRIEEEQVQEEVQAVGKGKGRQEAHKDEGHTNTEPHQTLSGIDMLLLAASVLEHRDSSTRPTLPHTSEAPQQNSSTASQDGMITAPHQNNDRNHDPERPWMCDICGKKYTAKPIMRRHLKINHGVVLGAHRP